jgi:hypothetical protein
MQGRPLGLSPCAGGGDRTATEEAPPTSSLATGGRPTGSMYAAAGPRDLFAAGAES